MLSYVIVSMLEHYEDKSLKSESSSCSVAGSRKKTTKQSSSMASQWMLEKVKVLSLFSRLAELELCSLWEPASTQLMEDWSRLVVQMCYKLLESPTIARERSLRENLASLLRSMVKVYSQGLGQSVSQFLPHINTQ